MQGSITRRRRRRLTPIALAAGVLGSAVLSLGATGTFSGLTATITNSTNTAGTGSLVMRQTTDAASPATLCDTASPNASDNSVSCTTPNNYGGTGSALTPGGPGSTTSMRIYDTGTLDPTGFTVTPGACTSSGSSGNICTKLKLTLTCVLTTGQTSQPAVTIYSAETLSSIANTAKNLKTTGAGCVPLKDSSTYATFTFTVQLDSTADNTMQGGSASQPLVWQFTNVT